MSSADEVGRAAELIDRLLVDPTLRQEFRRDPLSVCAAFGLDGLAADLGSGKAMHTLELRESRSSLAGVLMAIAAEGIGVAELQGLVGHGLHGPARAAALKALHPPHMRTPAQEAALLQRQAHLHGRGAAAAASPTTAGAGGSGAAGGGAGSAAAGGGSTAAGAAGTGGGGAGAAATRGSGAGAAVPGGGGAAADAHAAAAGGGAAGAGAGGSGASAARAGAGGSGASAARAGAGGSGASAAGAAAPGGGGVGGHASAGSAAAGSIEPPATGSAGSAAASSGAPTVGQSGGGVPVGAAGGGGGSASAGLSALLSSPRLSLPPAVRSVLASGQVDPRLVTVLDSALAHHTIGIGDLESATEPVHAQAIDIVSVDGQPVGPGNVAARDLVTEIAALDPSVRPSEIGTPWPIEAQGFFTDSAHQGRLHLAFVSPADYQPGVASAGAAAASASAATGAPAGSMDAAARAAAGPAAATPAAQGVAQAADAQLAADQTGTPAGQPQPAVQMVGGAPSATSGSGQGGAVQQQVVGQGAPVQQQVVGQGGPVQQVVGQGTAGGPGGPGDSGGYVNPLPAAARIGRTDMGVDVDLNPGDPIVAIGRSRVLGIMPGWYAGQPYLALQLLDGPMKGHNYYVAEQITPAVSVGQVVQAGDPIAHYASSGTGIEIGWAGPNWEQTLAQATGHDNAAQGDHSNTPAGISFRNFLDSLASHHAGHSPAASADVAGAGATAGTGASAGAGGASGPGGSGAAAGATAGSGASAGTAGASALGGSGAAAGGTSGAGGSGAAAGGSPSGSVVPEAVAGGGAAQVAQAGGAPGTAQFRALEPHERAFHRNTVKFMAAVQPGPESPLYGQTAGAGPPGTPVGAAADQSSVVPGAANQASVVPGAAGTGQPGQGPGPVMEQAGQGAVPAPDVTGGSISVSSHLLTAGQEKFAARLAQLTGLSPRVVAAWELAEESGSFAQQREAGGNFNWLNIGYFDSGAGRIAFDKAFGDPISAAEQTARFLKGQWGGASSSIRAILDSIQASPQQQMMAIANSDWASSHYGGGANLVGTYNELSDIQVTRS